MIDFRETAERIFIQKREFSARIASAFHTSISTSSFDDLGRSLVPNRTRPIGHAAGCKFNRDGGLSCLDSTPRGSNPRFSHRWRWWHMIDLSFRHAFRSVTGQGFQVPVYLRRQRRLYLHRYLGEHAVVVESCEATCFPDSL